MAGTNTGEVENKMKIVNLTPHAIHLPDRTIEPSGAVARCQEETIQLCSIDGIEFISRRYSDVYDLPDLQPNIIYIVSLLVRQALPDRMDLASPGDLIRDADGKIIGAKNLVINTGSTR
jgi:hypothetical protein